MPIVRLPHERLWLSHYGGHQRLPRDMPVCLQAPSLGAYYVRRDCLVLWQVLTLVSNERIPLTAAMRMIFEIHSLKNATPATVSRAGILFVNEVLHLRHSAETLIS